MVISSGGDEFCFHVPLTTACEWGIRADTLPRKEWISGKHFYRSRLQARMNEMRSLLASMNYKLAD